MCTTKEKILLTSLKLFAQDGYEAVSISKISGELGMAKSALYKHYKNKRDIFDSIINRMDELDYERAREYNMPDIYIINTCSVTNEAEKKIGN